MTIREALKKLDDIIGTPAPIVEAESLRKQLALAGDQGAQLSPEYEQTINDLETRTKESKEKHSSDKK